EKPSREQVAAVICSRQHLFLYAGQDYKEGEAWEGARQARGVADAYAAVKALAGGDPDEHIPMWNTVAKAILVGPAAPKRARIHEYLRHKPHMQLYTGQDHDIKKEKPSQSPPPPPPPPPQQQQQQQQHQRQQQVAPVALAATVTPAAVQPAVAAVAPRRLMPGFRTDDNEAGQSERVSWRAPVVAPVSAAPIVAPPCASHAAAMQAGGTVPAVAPAAGTPSAAHSNGDAEVQGPAASAVAAAPENQIYRSALPVTLVQAPLVQAPVQAPPPVAASNIPQDSKAGSEPLSTTVTSHVTTAPVTYPPVDGNKTVASQNGYHAGFATAATAVAGEAVKQ
ncbi:unnamed protein product, partial [Sphacelaria rigidula]